VAGIGLPVCAGTNGNNFVATSVVQENVTVGTPTSTLINKSTVPIPLETIPATSGSTAIKGDTNFTTGTNAITVSAPLNSGSYNGGIPLTTVQNGTVTGGLWYDAYPGFATSASKSFTLPAYTSVKWARLYVDVYVGHMTDNRRGTATIKFDCNNDGIYEIQKSESFNTTYSFPGEGGTGPVWLSDHMNRVTSDYLMWYDLTAITDQTVNIEAETTKTDSNFDGRIKTIVLVVAYDNSSTDTVKYWVNQGHDTVSMLDTTYTGSTGFGTSALNGGWSSANLTAIYLASVDGVYTFRGTSLASGIPAGSYFGTDTWDVTSLLTAGQNSSLVYNRTGDNYYKIPLAFMSIRYTGAPIYKSPVAAFTVAQTSTPLTVHFTDTSINSPTSWTWDFGDDTHNTTTNPTHTYRSAGTYSVNLTVSNPAGSSNTTRSVVVSKNPGGIDLSVTSLTPNGNAGDLFANEPNNITATIKNIGTAAAGPFVVRVSINNNSTESSATGLASGAQTSLVITDPVIRASGDVVTINVTVDTGNVINETDRTNNQYNLTKTVIYNGYKGKRYTGGNDVTTYRSYDIHGNLVCSPGDSEYKSGIDDWVQYTVTWSSADLPIPSGATVREARLYVPYTWDNSNQAPDHIHIAFNGKVVSNKSWYHDESGFSSWAGYAYGLLTYDVTSDFQANAQNSVILTRDTNRAKISPYGFTLVIVYEDSSETRKQIFLNEEFDLLGADSTNYATTPEEATAYVPFTGQTISTANVTRADLITFVPSGNGPEGDLLFNSNTLNTSTWQYMTNTQVAENTRDVTRYLTATGNEAGIRSTTTLHATMAASQEFLIVRYGPVVAFTQGTVSGDIPLTVTFTDQSIGSPTGWTWNFGDGSTSSLQNPTHTYTTAGTYTVKLTAAGSTGNDTLTKTGLVTVSSQAVYKDTFNFTTIRTESFGDSQTITIDTSKAAVNTSGKNLTVTGVGNGWDHLIIKLLAAPVISNSTVRGTVAGVTAVTEPVTVPLTSVGTPTVQVALGLEKLPEATAVITTTLTKNPDAISQSAFRLAATNNGKTIDDIAYTVTFSKTGIANSCDNGVIKNTIIYMAVSPAWLTANGRTTANVSILRYAENGTTSILQTDYLGTDSYGNYRFAGYSPDGLSTFVLTALSPVNQNNGDDNGGGSSFGNSEQSSSAKKSMIYDFILAPHSSYSGIEITTVSESGSLMITPLTADLPSMPDIKAIWKADIPQKPDGGGKITTAIMRNVSDSTRSAYQQALAGNGLALGNISYSMLVTKENVPETRNATIEMTIPQDWVYNNGGIDQIRIIRLDDSGNVQILDTAFCKYDRDSRYISFQASSPDGLCTFSLISVGGSGTVIQPDLTPAAQVTAGTQQSSDVVSSFVSEVKTTSSRSYLLGIGIAVVIVAGCLGLVLLQRSRKKKDRQ